MAEKNRINDDLFEPIGSNKRTPEAGKDDEIKPATYRIGTTLIDRINSHAEKMRVKKGDLVKALLTYALDDLEAGRLTFELTEPKGKREIKF